MEIRESELFTDPPDSPELGLAPIALGIVVWGLWTLAAMMAGAALFGGSFCG